jgi:hypothetical protein
MILYVNIIAEQFGHNNLAVFDSKPLTKFLPIFSPKIGKDRRKLCSEHRPQASELLGQKKKRPLGTKATIITFV